MGARTHGFFFSRKPGNLLFCAACFAMTVSTLLARFWPFKEMQPLTWKWCAIVWGYCVFCWLLQDLGKVLLYKAFSKIGGKKEVDQKKRRHQSVLKIALAEESMKAGGAKRAFRAEAPQKQMSVPTAITRISEIERELAELKETLQRM